MSELMDWNEFDDFLDMDMCLTGPASVQYAAGSPSSLLPSLAAPQLPIFGDARSFVNPASLFTEPSLSLFADEDIGRMTSETDSDDDGPPLRPQANAFAIGQVPLHTFRQVDPRSTTTNPFSDAQFRSSELTAASLLGSPVTSSASGTSMSASASSSTAASAVFLSGVSAPSTATATSPATASSTSPAACNNRKSGTTMVREGKADVIYRNIFSPLELEMPAFVEGARVYIHEDSAYPGKARRFKAMPDPGEHALVVRLSVRSMDGVPVTSPCAACDKYFCEIGIYKANPKLRGQMILTRCNRQMQVQNNKVTLHFKAMCAPSHVATYDSYQVDVEVMDSTGQLQGKSTMPLQCKQWKKGGIRVATLAATVHRV
mmetsp:Transcript_1987/g.6274  ORF Transcript_1987/g.6274 Transcript_1987/m.6274 type:complete len:374 (-) Transcript_1987:1219-2340(-)|eukprot:CAMPEP_0170755006 /NCGR_PEP_ID=MMETSP0437-20130122/13294_1 /TAXON_ID=0 /ORGANISM="Sexangularia sp." /LENGTH=373 /DNA_ID=CAMNT_0011094159 /DNA_START=134 /DNA_END=1255 /DNA_ORIENTATION=+